MLTYAQTPFLKNSFNAIAARFSEQPNAIKNVLLVGALMESSGAVKPELSLSDHIHVVQTIKHCETSGVLVYPGFNIFVQNLEYGDDFLKQPPAGMDLVVFSFVFRCAHDQGHGLYTQQSERTLEESAWHNALMATNAKYAVNIHANGPELPTRELARAPFHLMASRKSDTGFHYDIMRRMP